MTEQSAESRPPPGPRPGRYPELLRAAIDRGGLEPGKPVPSITALCQREVARETAAHGVKVLESEGLVRRYPGEGYFVLPR